MSYDLYQKQFTLKSMLGYISTSVISIAKPLLIAAPITVATILFATAAHAQTIKKDAPSSAEEAKSSTAPIAAPDAVRNGKPKGRETTGPRRPLRVGTPAKQSTTADKGEKVKPPKKSRWKERDPFN